MLLTACATGQERDYDFDGGISLEALENYLSRSIEFLGVCCEGSTGAAPHLEDNLRLIGASGAMFIGRAAYAWDCPADDEKHFRTATENAARIHSINPRIVLQACVFETTYSSAAPEVAARNPRQAGVENIPVPAWVFEEFGLPVESRNFNYEAMLYPDGRFRNHWVPGGSVPDISRLETRLWFFYRCARYIDAGYESIHFGQTQLMGRNDPGFAHWKDVLERVRRHASTHGRRHYVLCDAHFNLTRQNPGVLVDGKLLWDFLGFPLRPVETGEPLGAELRLGHGDTMYGRAPGGLHPSGWQCDVVPQLYEFDNCSGGLSAAGGIFIWGADESTWFANLPPARRDEVLRDFYCWIWENAPRGHLEMPGRRPARVPVGEPETWMYVANDASDACPEGFGQEAAIRSIWTDPRYADNGSRTYPESGSIGAEPEAVPPDGLTGRWRCDSPDGLPRVVRRRTREELYALYLVHGDRNPVGAASRGREILGRITAEQPSIIRDGAARFEGTAYLDMGASRLLATPQMTVALWVRIDDLARSWVLLEKFVWQQSGYYLKNHPPEGRLYAEVFDGNGGRRVVEFAGLTAGRWHHIAITADGRTLIAYVDGASVSSTPVGPVIASTRPLLVGRGCKGVSVRDIRIYAHALSADEMAQLVRQTRREGDE